MVQEKRLPNEILDTFSRANAGAVYLVAAGWKPAADLFVGANLARHQLEKGKLTQLGLGFEVETAEQRVPYESDAERVQLMDVLVNGHGLSVSSGNDGAGGHLAIADFPRWLVLWGDASSVPYREVAALEPGENNDTAFGRFFGYPECCIKSFRGRGSVKQYRQSLRQRIAQHGIESVGHLVGIEHVPCSLDCEKTRALGYADSLRTNMPSMYDNSLRCLDRFASSEL